jgi:hypothetical protein
MSMDERERAYKKTRKGYLKIHIVAGLCKVKILFLCCNSLKIDLTIVERVLIYMCSFFYMENNHQSTRFYL